MSASHLVIELNQQPIELCKLLKIANLVSGGGEAKMVISEGYVLLNGEVEFQKRKKVFHHDVIEFNGDVVQVEINENLAESEPHQIPTKKEPSQNKDKVKENVKNNVKKKTKKKDSEQAYQTDIKKSHEHIEDNEVLKDVKQSKRRPISF